MKYFKVFDNSCRHLPGSARQQRRHWAIVGCFAPWLKWVSRLQKRLSQVFLTADSSAQLIKQSVSIKAPRGDGDGDGDGDTIAKTQYLRSVEISHITSVAKHVLQIVTYPTC